MADIESTIIDDMLASEEMSLLDTPAFSMGDATAQGGLTPETLGAFNFLMQLMEYDIDQGIYDSDAFKRLGKNPMMEYMSLMEGKGGRVTDLLNEALFIDSGQQGYAGRPAPPSWQIKGGEQLESVFGGDFELMLRAAKMYADAVGAGMEGPAVRDQSYGNDPFLENTPNPPAGWRSVKNP
jgi:hypothetical protein